MHEDAVSLRWIRRHTRLSDADLSKALRHQDAPQPNDDGYYDAMQVTPWLADLARTPNHT